MGGRNRQNAQAAQQQAAEIIMAAQARAAAIVADGEQRLRGIEENLVISKAKELLASKAAA